MFIPAPLLFVLSSIAGVAFGLPEYRARSSLPEYHSLAGLPREEIDLFVRDAVVRGAQPPPPQITDVSAKLVNDWAHRYIAPGPNDLRGPCPGLNSLANHGWLPRSGIASPQEIVNAVMNGLNMDQILGSFVTWATMLVDGNHITNRMSIGPRTLRTGPLPPGPATVGGLNTHGVFEGDASTTRGDFYFGDNHSFNETLFQQLVSFSNSHGGGQYNIEAAKEVRWARIQDSIARNPTFDFTVPRFQTAFAESVFPYQFMVDGRSSNRSLDLSVARGFFQYGRMPPDFYRRNGSFGLLEVAQDSAIIKNAHPIEAGHNEGAGNYIVNPEDQSISVCGLYTKFVTEKVMPLYPKATTTGVLRTALNGNLATFYNIIAPFSNCTQLFPYGT